VIDEGSTMLLRARVTHAARTSVISLALATVAMPLATAGAGASSRPVITSAPDAVGFERDAQVAGRVRDDLSGARVRLEKSVGGGEWRTTATDRADADGRVSFIVEDLRRSAGYRLAAVDELTGEVRRSDRVRIAVRPKLTLRTSKHHVMNGRRVRVYGSLFPKVPGRRVLIAQKVDGRWRRIDRVRAGDGWFSTYLRPRDEGRRRLRVRFAGDDRNRRARDRSKVTVYSPGLATWYGPGLYGNTTACGQRLSSSTLGVAHRTLPCGTDVSILFRGRTITVPVIDRGPYSHADWDLTAETAQRLGFSGTDTIGTDRN
jgi:rare lipoprotein A